MISARINTGVLHQGKEIFVYLLISIPQPKDLSNAWNKHWSKCILQHFFIWPVLCNNTTKEIMFSTQSQASKWRGGKGLHFLVPTLRSQDRFPGVQPRRNFLIKSSTGAAQVGPTCRWLDCWPGSQVGPTRQTTCALTRLPHKHQIREAKTWIENEKCQNT